MALNNFKFNHLTSLHFNGLKYRVWGAVHEKFNIEIMWILVRLGSAWDNNFSSVVNSIRIFMNIDEYSSYVSVMFKKLSTPPQSLCASLLARSPVTHWKVVPRPIVLCMTRHFISFAVLLPLFHYLVLMTDVSRALKNLTQNTESGHFPVGTFL